MLETDLCVSIVIKLVRDLVIFVWWKYVWINI